jgi:hypothetical protein
MEIKIDVTPHYEGFLNLRLPHLLRLNCSIHFLGYFREFGKSPLTENVRGLLLVSDYEDSFYSDPLLKLNHPILVVRSIFP